MARMADGVIRAISCFAFGHSRSGGNAGDRRPILRVLRARAGLREAAGERWEKFAGVVAGIYTGTDGILCGWRQLSTF